MTRRSSGRPSRRSSGRLSERSSRRSPAASESGSGATPAARSGALVRNAGALMVSTVASATLGFVFWIAAARWFAADTVGQASALIASMTLLAGVAQLNLVSLYARFLPRAGARTERLILGGALASLTMSVVLSLGFLLLGLGRVSGADATPWWWLLFVAAVAASSYYFILDGMLTPLGRASWVAAKNVLTSVAKVGLLAVLVGAAAGTGTGMFLAWMVPVFTAVATVGALVAFRFAPAHARASRPDPTPHRRGEVAAFVSAEYVNGIIANIVAFVPPVLVTQALGPTANAYFYIPWIIGVAATTLLWNVVTSFVVAASADSRHARRHLDHAVRLGLLVVVPGAVLLAGAATPLLGLLGPDYAANGAAPLRLIGLSLPFTGLVLLYAAFCIMDKRMWALAVVQSGAAAILVAGSWWGLSRLGATAVALSYLVCQAAAGLVVLPVVVRRYRAVSSVDRRPAWARHRHVESGQWALDLTSLRSGT